MGISGLSMQGARWDPQNNLVDKSRPKEMVSVMPVINVKGVGDGQENEGCLRVPNVQDGAARPHLRLRRAAEDQGTARPLGARRRSAAHGHRRLTRNEAVADSMRSLP